MKKFFFLVLLATFATGVASAQNFRLNGYAGYAFDDGFDSYYSNNDYYEGTIEGGFQWGVGFEYLLHDRYSIELLYYNHATSVPVVYQRGVGGLESRDFDLTLHYIMLAGNSLFKNPTGKVEGYGGLLLGMAIADLTDPTDNREGSVTKFAWGARLGANIWASEKFGIKLQAQLLSVAQATGGGFYFGTGAGVAVTNYSTIYQIVLGGGLAFRFGQPTGKPGTTTQSY